MFERLKKVFGKSRVAHDPDAGASSLLAYGPVSEWAATQGLAFTVENTGKGMALEGKVGNKPWRLQLGRPTRNYIVGEEVRARCDLGIPEQVAVLVINRALKESLEKRAYKMYTDSVQTSVDSTLPEEMRWLALYDEVGWDAIPQPFWDRYSVLTDSRDNAQKWLDTHLAQTMLQWQEPAPSAEVPFMVLLLNGKAYLRMEYTPPDLATLQQAATIFSHSCEAALEAFGRKYGVA